jgi:pimeloyl-ACP methyl ester carboxylesterase
VKSFIVAEGDGAQTRDSRKWWQHSSLKQVATEVEGASHAVTSSEDITHLNEKRRWRGVIRWVRRIALGLLILLITLAVTGLIYQAVATQNDRQEFPPPGQLVAVDGYQLHINCTGEGSPTVILDAAGGNTSPSWGLVQPEIGQSTRVCAYDRAGMGWSERGPRPRDMKQQVGELRALLAAAAIDAPYVLVGHSYGGRIARVYAKEYPSEVVGMVLIDPGTLDDDPRFPPERQAELASEKRTIILARWLAPFGLVRLLLPRVDYDDLPTEQAAAMDTFGVTTKYFQVILDQYRALPQTYRQEREVTSLGSIPLIVVSATTPDDETRRVWTEINGELAELSMNSVHRVIQGATHSGLLWRREHAQVTIDAIQQVIEAVRTGQPLAR